MTFQCAWCIAEGLVVRDPEATHGICDQHLAELYPEEEEEA